MKVTSIAQSIVPKISLAVFALGCSSHGTQPAFDAPTPPTTDAGSPDAGGPPLVDMTPYVNPFIGTDDAPGVTDPVGGGSGGSVFPGATVPWGMVQLSPEIVAQADPDVLLLTDFGYDRLGSKDAIGKSLPGIASTKAVRSGRIGRVEEHDLVYIGPRTGENVLALQKLIHAGK